jgi:hypothetical protein
LHALDGHPRWQSRKADFPSVVLGTGTVLLWLLLAGCGALGRQEIYSSAQPGGAAVLILEQRCGLSDCAVTIVVRRGWGSQRIAYRRGCTVNFAQAAWVGSVVGVFVDGGTCQSITAAYDVSSDRVIPFKVAAGAVRAAIIRNYGVKDSELAAVGGDAFRWATYPGDGLSRRSTVEFSKRYPH